MDQGDNLTMNRGLGCDAGKYGKTCASCSAGCKDATCDQTSGHCTRDGRFWGEAWREHSSLNSLSKAKPRERNGDDGIHLEDQKEKIRRNSLSKAKRRERNGDDGIHLEDQKEHSKGNSLSKAKRRERNGDDGIHLEDQKAEKTGQHYPVAAEPKCHKWWPRFLLLLYMVGLASGQIKAIIFSPQMFHGDQWKVSTEMGVGNSARLICMVLPPGESGLVLEKITATGSTPLNMSDSNIVTHELGHLQCEDEGTYTCTHQPGSSDIVNLRLQGCAEKETHKGDDQAPSKNENQSADPPENSSFLMTADVLLECAIAVGVILRMQWF